MDHATAGPEDRPLNLWRIVLLTDGVKEELMAPLTENAKSPYLRVSQ